MLFKVVCFCYIYRNIRIIRSCIPDQDSGEMQMAQEGAGKDKKVPFEFIVDILKWLLEINFHKYGKKKPSL